MCDRQKLAETTQKPSGKWTLKGQVYGNSSIKNMLNIQQQISWDYSLKDEFFIQYDHFIE